jgi:hypothetical protein
MKAVVLYCCDVCGGASSDGKQPSATVLTTEKHDALDAVARKGSSGFLTDTGLTESPFLRLLGVSAGNGDGGAEVAPASPVQGAQGEGEDSQERKARAQRFFPQLYGRARVLVLTDSETVVSACKSKSPELAHVIACRLLRHPPSSSSSSSSAPLSLADQIWAVLHSQQEEAHIVVVHVSAPSEVCARVQAVNAAAHALLESEKKLYLSLVFESRIDLPEALDSYRGTRDERLGYTADHEALFLRPASSSSCSSRCVCMYTSYCPDVTRVDSCTSCNEEQCMMQGAYLGMSVDALLPEIVGKLQLRDKYGN